MAVIPRKYPTEVKDRAVRMALEHVQEYGSAMASAHAVGAQLGIAHNTLQRPVKPRQYTAPYFTEHLTVDTGSVHLDRQVTAVTTLMQVSRWMEEFKELFNRRFGTKPQSGALRVEVTAQDEVLTLFEVDDHALGARTSGQGAASSPELVL